jgi:hypothetical protein
MRFRDLLISFDDALDWTLDDPRSEDEPVLDTTRFDCRALANELG